MPRKKAVSVPTKPCPVCGKEIDIRGIANHVRTHGAKGKAKAPAVETHSYRMGYRDGFRDAKE